MVMLMRMSKDRFYSSEHESWFINNFCLPCYLLVMLWNTVDPQCHLRPITLCNVHGGCSEDFFPSIFSILCHVTYICNFSLDLNLFRCSDTGKYSLLVEKQGQITSTSAFVPFLSSVISCSNVSVHMTFYFFSFVGIMSCVRNALKAVSIHMHV